MISTLTPSTRRASFAIGNEQAAKHVVDLLNESISRARPRSPRSRDQRALARHAEFRRAAG